MNKAIWGVLGALIVIVLGFFFVTKMGNNQSTTGNSTTSTETTASPTSTESATPAAQVITYTNSGFTPKTLTVKVGDTVTFTNDSSQSMWVASNPHPTHTDYAGFDAKTGMSRGESYMFTFTKAGTWGFHNHLHSTDGGTIIVQ